MVQLITDILVFGPPVTTVVLFIVFLVRYLMAPRGSELRRSRRLPLLITSIILGTLVLIVAALAALLITAVAFM